MAVKSVYVGNLPYSATEEEVRRLFSQWGPVDQVRLISEKGFAFVDLPAEKVSDAIRAVNGQSLNGRALRVDEARPRAPRQDSFRSSSDSGYRMSPAGDSMASDFRPDGNRDRGRTRDRGRGRERRRDYSDW